MSHRDALSGERQHTGAVGASAPGYQRFVVWPHRSLGRKGVILTLGVFAFGLFLAIARVWEPGGWFIIIPAAITFAGLVFAFWLSSRRAELAEIVELSPDEVTIRRRVRGQESVVARFNPHWVRLRTHTDRYFKNRIILSESGRAVAIGDFLSPPERRELAHALLAGLEGAKQSPFAPDSATGRP